MTNIQIGNFPGRLESYALDENTTVKDALKMANIEITEEQEIKLDGVTVTPDTMIGSGKLLVVTKRIKGMTA